MAVVPEYEIRQMKIEDIPDVFELRKETNFRVEGLNTIYTWYEYDPGAFFVAVSKDGKIIGVCAGILQNEDLAFIGMYVVKKSFQGRGIGKKIWNRVMERIGDRNIGINTGQENLENYRLRGGLPFQSHCGSLTFTMHDVCLSKIENVKPGVDINVVSSDDVDLIKAIADYDANVMGFSRDRLFPIIHKEKDSVIVIARNVSDNSTCGYGIIKQSINNYAFIGPLYADDKSIAEVILYHLLKSFPVAMKEGAIFISVDCNLEALDMWERLGFLKHRHCLRLYRHKIVDCNFQKVFVLFSETYCAF